MLQSDAGLTEIRQTRAKRVRTVDAYWVLESAGLPDMLLRAAYIFRRSGEESLINNESTRLILAGQTLLGMPRMST